MGVGLLLLRHSRGETWRIQHRPLRDWGKIQIAVLVYSQFYVRQGCKQHDATHTAGRRRCSLAPGQTVDTTDISWLGLLSPSPTTQHY